MSVAPEQRTTRSRPCPICGRWGWCIYLAGGDAAWCGHVPGGRPSKDGWIHRLDGPRVVPPVRVHHADRAYLPPAVLAKLARRFYAAMGSERPRRLADQLRVNITSLRRLGAGWVDADQLRALNTKCIGPGCWTFPQRNATGEVIGIRLRVLDGSFKYAIDGSDGSGLFIPARLDHCRELFAPEGPTSCAALLTLGLHAVGRPNNRAGREHLRHLVRLLRPRRLIVLGDNDLKRDGMWPGRDGAMSVAEDLRGECPQVSWSLPPPHCKDARDWLADGATAAEVIRSTWMEADKRDAG